MGLFTWLFGKKQSGTGILSDSLNLRRAMLAVAEIGATAKTGSQARQAMAEMVAVLERGGGDHEPTRAVAARVRSTVSKMSDVDDAVAVEACHMLAQGLTETARRIEEAQSRMTGRSAVVNRRSALPERNRHVDDIPFTTFRGFLKRHAQEELNPLEEELFDFLFPRFHDDNGAKKAHEQWKAHPLTATLSPLVEVVPGDTRHRRFAGANFPRSCYFTVCTDETGDDRQTMVHELRAYRDPSRSGMVEVIDLARGCSLQIGETVHEIPTQRAVGVLLHDLDLVPPELRQLPFRRLPDLRGKPLHFYRFPYAVEMKCVERTIDLRLPRVRDWFFRTFRSPNWTAPPLPGVEPDYTTAYSRFHFENEKPPTPASFTEMLPTLLNPDLGGGSIADTGSVLLHVAHELRQHGCGALIFPSARSDASVVFVNGTMTQFFGWNLVWYEGAPVYGENVHLTTFAPNPWAWVKLPAGVQANLAPEETEYTGSLVIQGMVNHWADDYLGQIDALAVAREIHGPKRKSGIPPDWVAFTLGALSIRWLFLVAEGLAPEKVHRSVLEMIGLSLPYNSYYASGRILELWADVQTTGQADPRQLAGVCFEVADRLGRNLSKVHDRPELSNLVLLGCYLELFRTCLLCFQRQRITTGPLPTYPPADVAKCRTLGDVLLEEVNAFFSKHQALERIRSADVVAVLERGANLIDRCRNHLKTQGGE